MQKLAIASVVGSVVGAAFLAGIAVGKTTVQPKFIAAEEVKWDDLGGGGPRLGGLTGDYKKGAFGGLLKLPAGFTSPLHSHTAAYEAIEIQGTTSHWLKGEDGTKAKKMTPGSYWSMPGKLEHVSACAPGQDCIMYVWQKSKFDFVAAKDDKAAATKAAGSTAAPAAPAKAGGSTAAPAASPAKAGGSTAAPAAPAKAGGSTAAPAAPAKK